MARPRAPKAESWEDVFGALSDRLAQTIRRPNIYRYKPLPEQDLFHQSTKKGRILFGGNRGGKTYGGGADDVLILTKRHPHRAHLYPSEGPIRMRFIGVDFERGIDQGALPLFAELIPPSFLVNGSWEDSYSASKHMLTLADKSTCSFMSYEQDANKFQIVSLHHIHFDEEPPKPIFDESMMRLVDTAGSWTLSETPVQQLEWVQDELIEKAESGVRKDIDIFYLNTLDNVNLPPEELAALVAGMSAEEQIVRLAGRYRNDSRVFPEFERSVHVIDAADFVLTAEWTVYESMDHGYANPTAWIWTAVHPDGSIVTFRSLYSPMIVVSDWAKAVKQMRKEIGALLGLGEENSWAPRATVGDPSISHRNNGITGITVQQAYAKDGVYIGTEGIVSARSKNQNIGLDKMHTYLSLRPEAHPRGALPWWQITDNNTALIDEVKRARKPKQTLNNKEVKNTSEEIRDKDNHAIDGVKYLFISTHELRPEEYQESDTSFEQLGLALQAAPPAVHTHRDVYTAMVSGTGTVWNVSGGANGSDYSSLEG